tara:strand:+ start:2867 stop:3793 length:927 start_codon:yes stop_codon:yes gene_type:complete
MFKREDLLKERLLRENIRKAISIVQKRNLKQESYIRNILSSLLSEATTFKYEYTSLNQLAHFIKEAVGDPSKPDSNPAFKDAYTDLTSDHKDRERFVEFIIDFADEDFKTIDANKEPRPLGQDFVDKGFVDDEAMEPEEEKDEMVKISIEDLEEKGGDLTGLDEEKDEDDDIMSIGEDGEILFDEEEESAGIKRFSREAYKRVGPVLRRYYLNVPKDMSIKKSVDIDGQEYQSGQLSERDLFKIYFKKNIALWAERYEEEFFNDTPETNIDIDSAQDDGEIEDITPPDQEDIETGMGDEEEFDVSELI